MFSLLKKLLVILVYLLLVFVFLGCEESDNVVSPVLVDLCEDIDCNLHGECVVDKDTEGEAIIEDTEGEAPPRPYCVCDDGYFVDGLKCIVDLCSEMECQEHKYCEKNYCILKEDRCDNNDDCVDGKYCYVDNFCKIPCGELNCGENEFCDFESWEFDYQYCICIEDHFRDESGKCISKYDSCEAHEVYEDYFGCVLGENNCYNVRDCPMNAGFRCVDNECKNICAENNVNCGEGGVCFAISDTEYSCGCIGGYTLLDDGKCHKENWYCRGVAEHRSSCEPYYCKYEDTGMIPILERSEFEELVEEAGGFYTALCKEPDNYLGENFPISQSWIENGDMSQYISAELNEYCDINYSTDKVKYIEKMAYCLPEHFNCNYDSDCPESAPKCDDNRDICYTPCAHIDCSNHGECKYSTWSETQDNPDLVYGTSCYCDEGYSNHQDKLCVEDFTECEDIDCSNNGYCALNSETEEASCICDEDYQLSQDGLRCMPINCYIGLEDAVYYNGWWVYYLDNEDGSYNSLDINATLCASHTIRDKLLYFRHESTPIKMHYKLSSPDPNVRMIISTDHLFRDPEAYMVTLEPGDSKWLNPADYDLDGFFIKIIVENPVDEFDYEYHIEVREDCIDDDECGYKSCIDGECHDMRCNSENCSNHGVCTLIAPNNSEYTCECEEGYYHPASGAGNCLLPLECNENTDYECNIDENILSNECIDGVYSLEDEIQYSDFLGDGEYFGWCTSRHFSEKQAECLLFNDEPECNCKDGLVLAEDNRTCVYPICEDDDFITSFDSPSVIDSIPFIKNNLTICPNTQDYFKINYNDTKEKFIWIYMLNQDGEAIHKREYRSRLLNSENLIQYSNVGGFFYYSRGYKISSDKNIIRIRAKTEASKLNYSLGLRDYCEEDKECEDITGFPRGYYTKCLSGKCMMTCERNEGNCDCIDGICYEICTNTSDCKYANHECVEGYCK